MKRKIIYLTATLVVGVAVFLILPKSGDHDPGVGDKADLAVEDPSIAAERVEGSEISQTAEFIAILEKFKGSDNAKNSEIDAIIEELKTNEEIAQDPETKAKIEAVVGLKNYFDHFSKRLKDLEKNGLFSGAVKVIENPKPRPPLRVQYLSDDRAAELGLSSLQVAEFQKIVNYYRQRLDQHISDNSTVEVLGDGHHKIEVPEMENSSEIRDAVNEELRLLLGTDKYDEFVELDKNRIHDFFDHYGEHPRTFELEMNKEGPFGGKVLEYNISTHFKWHLGRMTRRQGGTLHSIQNNPYKVYTDLIASKSADKELTRINHKSSTALRNVGTGADFP